MSDQPIEIDELGLVDYLVVEFPAGKSNFSGSRLKPAPGWQFRVQVLGEDLILRPENGIAGIVQDELGNTYDLAGPG